VDRNLRSPYTVSGGLADIL